MKTPEEMAEYFKSMPSRKKENPYWEFCEEPLSIQSKLQAISGTGSKPFDLQSSKQTLCHVREFFRRYYESFHSEAQVLCVAPDDAEKLNAMGIPIITDGIIAPFDVTVVELPQDNSGGTSRISEWFWQNRIVNAGIHPIARIHSHHVLDPYQSSTDYSTLNSGTLEMVIGRIFEENLSLCYWLDVPGTDIKAQTFLTKEEDGVFTTIPHKFHGPNAPHFTMCAKPGEWLKRVEPLLKQAAACDETVNKNSENGTEDK